MKLMGIGDEAGASLVTQLAATQELGWKFIELRTVEVAGHPKANLHELSDAAFDAAAQLIEPSGIRVYCFGSTVMNWAKKLTDPFAVTLAEVQRCIPRMQRLGTKFVRIMSFKPGEAEYQTPAEVFRRVKDVTHRFLDAGLQPVHENCMNYGGMSWQHTLELLDRCPGLKLVFDTANPVFNPDRSRPRPWPRQDAWEFWTHVRDHVVHLHIKDASYDPATNTETYHWPGAGQGCVREILADAQQRGYAGGLSIEPHMVTVFHDPQAAPHAPAEAARKNFVAYGQRLQALLP
ncbi:MAG TPA: TIM barrel protein [Verrucomicrobiota bacterium]|nr:TIM barrel protein [Verrucomicrobiota bacterium]HNT15531.1 TIM barrel protein [Verrucomicrobiota bacterium]